MMFRLTHLFQLVFAALVAGALSFGASRALASESTAAAACEDLGYDYQDPNCASRCPNNIGYCAEGGICRCGHIP